MEILIIFVIALVLAVVFGVPIEVVLYVVLGILALFCVLCDLFFIISLIMLPFSKKKQAEFLDIEKGDRGMSFAYYQVDDIKCRCLLPTDAFLKALIYRKKDVFVRQSLLGKKDKVYDIYALITIGLGFTLFSLFTVLLGLLLVTL